MKVILGGLASGEENKRSKQAVKDVFAQVQQLAEKLEGLQSQLNGLPQPYVEVEKPKLYSAMNFPRPNEWHRFPGVCNAGGKTPNPNPILGGEAHWHAQRRDEIAAERKARERRRN